MMKTLALADSPSSNKTSGVHSGVTGVSPASAGLLAGALCVVGVLSVYSLAATLWHLWIDDPLKSVGVFVPVISLLLILRAWRSLNWQTHGTWWGLALLAVVIASVHLRDVALLELVLTTSWSIFLPPNGLLAVAYAAGAVLLFGGIRLLRKAKFPVALMFLVNPAPNFFLTHIDLPLQHVSSLTARGFAHMLGQRLTPDQLYLMFTPEFGMFIAPGCNGIRGAVTMGMIALVAGYLYRFKPRVIALFTVGAVLLGYVFNLVRLCGLVVYSIVAVHIPWLQGHAMVADYIIGGCLFFFATVLLFTLIQRLGPGGDLRLPALVKEPLRPGEGRVPVSFYLRWAAFAVLIVAGSASYTRAMLEARRAPKNSLDPKVMGHFPQRVGGFRLADRWNETLITGALVYYWSDYVKADGTVVSVGFSPLLGAHDVALCHAAQGEDWVWHGNLPMQTRAGELNFSGFFFSEGDLQYMEAAAICSNDYCGQFTDDRTHFGFVYSRPDTAALLSDAPAHLIPVLLRAKTTDFHLSASAARMKLTADLREFVAATDLSELTRPYRVASSLRHFAYKR